MSDLRIGDVSIDRALIGPKPSDEPARRELEAVIASLGGPAGDKALSMEKQALDLLRAGHAEITYSALDPSFLEMANQVVHDKHAYSLPKFSVYKIMETPGNLFCVEFSHEWLVWSVSFGPFAIPKVLAEALVKSTDYSRAFNFTSQTVQGWVFDGAGTPRDVKKKYRSLGHYRFSNTFHGLIPLQSKAKLEGALRTTFTPDEIYLIAETKPEAWKGERLPSVDPLLVGVIKHAETGKETCYLIDAFHTTPLERYVSREWRP